ncbi:MAG: methionine--tRNA ligase [Proteobacteria bacterium]|nr:methionine--tRNA ligase [Pseudomonadota bacterium]
MTTREILVTSALPYANGPIHLGHMLEHIQSDIWVRAMRMAGHSVHYVCADDAHGSAIMLRAEKEGITPQALIDGVWKEHSSALRDFGVAYDHYSSTHTDANRELTARIWLALRAAGHTESKPVKQLYDPVKEMFLPDRYIKGECPKCHSKDQYGDGCEVCGTAYTPADLINPYSVVSGATPVLRESEHYFVKLADFEAMLKGWLAQRRDAGALQAEVVNKLQEWFADGLRSWDVSRDAPYFGFEIPDAPGKYFYVWVDAPIGYFAAFKELCDSGRSGLKPADLERFIRADSKTDMVHFIGKDIVYFHTLFWPAMLHGAGLRTPTAVNVHGFLTVNGAKMSKSRGTFIQARTYLNHLDPDWLRYYLASLLGPTLADVDLDMKAFEERVNSHLVGKWVNIASRCAGFVHKFFGGKLSAQLPAEASASYADAAKRLSACAALYEARDYAAALRLIMDVADTANAYVADKAPWKMAKDDGQREHLHVVCTLALNYFRLLTIWLAPVVPSIAARAFAFLGEAPPRFEAANTPRLGATLNEFSALTTRIDPLKIEAMIEASKENLQAATPSPQPLPREGGGAKAAASTSPPAGRANRSEAMGSTSPLVGEVAARSVAGEGSFISIDDFARMDLRIGTVLECGFVEGSDKLLRFVLDAGELGRRQIFSGIRAAYAEPEKLIGRKVVFIANLAPRKMRFGVSEGMILSAGSGGDDLHLLDADAGAKAGMPVK